MSPLTYLAGGGIFCGVTILALLLFAASVIRHVRVLRSLQPLPRCDRIPDRLRGVFVRVFGQLKLFRDPLPGLMHALIFWGFCAISIESLHFFAGAFGIHARLPLTSGIFYAVYETFLVLVGLMVIVAFIRRMKKKSRITKSGDALFVLFLIFVLVVTGLILSGAETVLSGQENGWRYLSNYAQMWLFSGTQAGLVRLYNISWWLHGLTFLVFLNYLPFSKHMHVLTIVFNVFFRDLEARGRIEKIDLENAERFGLADVNDLTWKDALDGHTCTECGRCTVVCPVNRVGKNLDPRRIILDIRDYLRADQKRDKDAQPEPTPILAGTIKKDDIFACTTCHACVTACPVENEHLGKIIRLRQNLVLMEGDMPDEYQRTFRNLETNANPWGIASSQRGEWAAELKLPTLADNPDAEILYYMGCAACYDNRAKKIAASFTRLLLAAKVNFAVLGKEEFCCGDSARRMGNEYLFQEMLGQGREVIEKYKLTTRKFVTTDPHCFNILKNEYRDFGLPLDVTHHTTFLRELLTAGKLKLQPLTKRSVTFHDSCYLGRYNEIFSAPRELLTQIGAEPHEMAHNRQKSLCCGAGGGRVFMEDELENRVNVARAKEAIDTQAEAVVMACPYCVLMFEDGLKTLDNATPVYDIAELLAAQLPE